MSEIETTEDLPILLFGDAIDDRYILPLKRTGATGQGSDWKNYDQFFSFQEDGGVHMTQLMLNFFREGKTRPFVAEAPKKLESLAILQDVETDDKTGLPKKTRSVEASDGSELTPEEQKEKYSKLNLRVEKNLGYREVEEKRGSESTEGLPVPDHEIVVINDAGNDLRKENCSQGKFLKTVLSSTTKTVILKMHLPLAEGEVWTSFSEAKNASRRVVFVQAEDLRQHGIRIARSPSWDAVVDDLRDAMADDAFRKLMLTDTSLIVLFGVEAAALIDTGTDDQEASLRLVCDPKSREGDTDVDLPGSMIGKMNAFLAAFVDRVLDLEANGDLGEAVCFAMQTTRAFATDSYLVDEKGQLRPRDIKARVEAEQQADDGERVHYVLITPDIGDTANLLRDAIDQLVSVPLDSPRAGDDSFDAKVRYLAETIVLFGPDGPLANLPHARIGGLRTLDRNEIESLRSIGLLIRDYNADKSRATPISFAVFGAPGAGKSFGVKQLVDKNENPTLEFNLSQATEDTLPLFFQEIRDVNLKGKVPLCFFDEFDSGDRQLIKNFLAPMQDGEYRDGDAIRPVGRGIFVFAGGTAPSFARFAGIDRDLKMSAKELADAEELESKQKLPDFVSRLSGYLDIAGVASSNGAEKATVAFLHRALLLRSLLENKFTSYAPKKRQAALTYDLVNWLLEEWSPQHGARSLETILRGIVSNTSTGMLGHSDLPGPVQMTIHTAR